MARIFFKKEGQKPSIFATLGLITTGLAFLALIVAGPVFRLGVFGDPSNDPNLFDLQFKLIAVTLRLIVVAAGFTLAGIIHGRTSSRARASWRAIVAAVLTAAMGVPVAKVYYQAHSAPVLHDITTSADNPPRFEALPERTYDAVSAADVLGGRLDANYAAKLRAAYPGLASIPFTGSRQAAAEAALKAVRKLGWTVVKSDMAAGRIEAIYTSPWFGFRSFVAIEVRANDASALLDMRAVSEMGHTDMGINAHLIGALQSGLRQQG